MTRAICRATSGSISSSAMSSTTLESISTSASLKSRSPGRGSGKPRARQKSRSWSASIPERRATSSRSWRPSDSSRSGCRARVSGSTGPFVRTGVVVALVTHVNEPPPGGGLGIDHPTGHRSPRERGRDLGRRPGPGHLARLVGRGIGLRRRVLRAPPARRRQERLTPQLGGRPGWVESRGAQGERPGGGEEAPDRSIVVGLELPEQRGALAVPADREGEAAVGRRHVVGLEGLPQPGIGHGRQEVQAATPLVHGETADELEHGGRRCRVVALPRAAAAGARVDQLGPGPHGCAPIQQPGEGFGRVDPADGQAGRTRPRGEPGAQSGAARRVPGAPLDQRRSVLGGRRQRLDQLGRHCLRAGQRGRQGDGGREGAGAGGLPRPGARRTVGGEGRDERGGQLGRHRPRLGRRVGLAGDVEQRTRRRGALGAPRGRRGRSARHRWAPRTPTGRRGTGRPSPPPADLDGRPCADGGGERPWPRGPRAPRRGSGRP